VQAVRVFGSVAKGTARPDSDIDLLVEMEKGRSLLDIVGFEQDLEDLLKVKVDVVTEGFLRERIRAKVRAEAQPL
jgi:predicted nucleotidyltransferase